MYFSGAFEAVRPLAPLVLKHGHGVEALCIGFNKELIKVVWQHNDPPMRAQVVWQINRVADCQQVKSAVGWSVFLDEFRLILLLREFDFKSVFAHLVMRA
ncbi:hypothetical protein [Rhizobium leguminosarum]|uniref:hypothetical protein n=1 Tax=Rhizobium leguminosarum TaxID=384 RepID=UPI0004B893E3|nr:hypothetical protein [Rhizobium leguminosarum]